MGNKIIFFSFYFILNFGHIYIYIYILITINKKIKYFNNKQGLTIIFKQVDYD